MDNKAEIKPNPLSKELYSIDWAARFEKYEKFEQSLHKDLDSILAKVEEFINQTIEIDENLDDFEKLQSRLNNAKSDSEEWHAIAMLINLRTISHALPKRMTHTAVLCAMDIMGHLRQSLANSAASVAPIEKYIASNTAKNNATKKRVKAKVQRTKPQVVKSKTPVKQSKPKKPANEQKTKEPAVAENVVIKKLTNEVGGDDDKPLSIRCSEVANMLAEEYPQYTLTAIRVMTAEKLGVTRQYVENLDIKPARFKNG